MSKRYKRVVLIGRFEPTHRGHQKNFIQALDIAEKVIILVGSSYQPRTPKNPFDFAERIEMISKSILSERVSANFSIYPLRDFKYSNNSWIAAVQQVVKDDSPGIADSDISIMGFDKDETSWYNHAFPEWKFVALDGFVEHGSKPIDATQVRNLYFDGHLDFLRGAVPESTFHFMKKWATTPEYEQMAEEHRFYRDYHKKWEHAPFVPVFQTTDAVVIQGGHILLIQRGRSPGRGLWALPGGFLNPKERLDDGVIRELVEETKIKVPEIVLRKGITYKETFDHPDRDLRGRTITTAYLIELTGGNGILPRVKGSDDAEKARWFKLADIKDMGEMLYGDHQHIIETLVARARS